MTTHQPSSSARIDYRRETLYTDRGQRQSVTPGGMSRTDIDPAIFSMPKDTMFLPRSSSVTQVDHEPSQRERLRKRSLSKEPDPIKIECDCPPTFNCIHRRESQQSDDRVRRQWMGDHERMDQEAFERKTTASLQPSSNVFPVYKLASVIQYLDTIDTTPWHMETVRELTFNNLRSWIIKANGHDVREEDLRSAHILPRLKKFLSAAHSEQRHEMGVTDFIFEELSILHKKWARGDYLCDPNRGLTRTEVRDVNGTTYHTKYQLDKSWAHYPGHFYGEGNLVNGQTWYSREQLMRDGAHSASQGGISGSAADGARSIVMNIGSHTNQYGDVDQFDTIEYEGTILSRASTADKPEPTNASKALIRSKSTETPVRVIRSFKLPTSVNGAVMGYRYDGLYQVTGYKLRDKRLQRYVFTLKRIEDQGTLRGIKTEDPAPRPQKRAKTAAGPTYSFIGSRSRPRSSLSIRGPPRGY